MSGCLGEDGGRSGAASPFRLMTLDETTSTNDEVKRALEAGEPEGLAVLARRQTGGYGRHGRTWASPEGGMYLSLLLRPCVVPARLPTLSLAVSVAVRRALTSLDGLVHPDKVLIKWPNDLVVPLEAPSPQVGGGCGDRPFEATPRASREGARYTLSAPSLRSTYRKLCGISLEAHAGGICVGIGVNVQSSSLTREVVGENTLISLSERGYADSIDKVAAAVLRALESVYALWCTEGFMPFQQEYESCSFLSGRFVGMVDQLGNLMAEGTVSGIDQQGRLVLETSSGAFVPVSSGEAHVR
ncbi:MAG: biotin--[acetyl-CoA-carboxylase] ligase [Gordonibacter sp.]|uniref:biotin--[acetyl-CoA-carboxylase] ligase n=1 Tax=Gordonibacter sp. TaxID=1968902 RepID=UPI00321FE969